MLDDIAELAQSVGVPVQDVTRTKLHSEARTESPQGVLARAARAARDRPGGPGDHARGVARRRSCWPSTAITDPGNLGALLRSAECAGVTGVVLPRHRAVHITPTVTKAAAGSIEYLRFALVGGLPTAIRQLQEAGVWVVGLDAGGARRLFDLEVADRPIALVLGAEGAGLSRLVRERCDEVVVDPVGGPAGLAQRGRGRRGGLLRGGPAPPGPLRATRGRFGLVALVAVVGLGAGACSPTNHSSASTSTVGQQTTLAKNKGLHLSRPGGRPQRGSLGRRQADRAGRHRPGHGLRPGAG